MIATGSEVSTSMATRTAQASKDHRSHSGREDLNSTEEARGSTQACPADCLRLDECWALPAPEQAPRCRWEQRLGGSFLQSVHGVQLQERDNFPSRKEGHLYLLCLLGLCYGLSQGETQPLEVPPLPPLHGLRAWGSLSAEHSAPQHSDAHWLQQRHAPTPECPHNFCCQNGCADALISNKSQHILGPNSGCSQNEPGHLPRCSSGFSARYSTIKSFPTRQLATVTGPEEGLCCLLTEKMFHQIGRASCRERV